MSASSTKEEKADVVVFEGAEDILEYLNRIALCKNFNPKKYIPNRLKELEKINKKKKR